MQWGVDLGSRYIHMVGLPEGVEEGPLFFSTQVEKGSRDWELNTLSRFFQERVLFTDHVWIEEPPFVNNRRVFLALAQTCGALLATSPGKAEVVPVALWKAQIIGDGGASKEVVATWLFDNYPELHERAHGDQNFMDAACIALFGYSAGKDQ